MALTANGWIERLGLKKHPEGGYFREVYRSSESIRNSALPDRFDGERDFSTAIYFLLKGNEVSRFHRIKQDEIWHFYDGSPVSIYTIVSHRMTVFRLGNNPDKGQLPMVVIPQGTIFAAELEDKRSFCLMGCTVSPGFDFKDFELLDRAELLQIFPEHYSVVQRLTSA